MRDPLGSDPPPSAELLRAIVTALLDRYLRVLIARDRHALLGDQYELVLRTILEALKKGNTKEVISCVLGREFSPPPEALRLKVRRHIDGAAMIHIDDLKPFRLSRGLTDFLERLASDEGISEDKLVPWKSRESLWQFLRKNSSKPVNRKYVAKRVNDLRRCLEKAGVDPDLIQSQRSQGVRFRLRRPASPTLRPVGGGRW
jgi:hypothetical protein